MSIPPPFLLQTPEYLPLALWQIVVGIPRIALIANLEVQVGTGAVASIAHSANLLPRRHCLTGTHEDRVQVGIERDKTIAVINDDLVAIAAVPAAASNGDEATIRCLDGRSLTTSNVQRLVTAPVVL